MTHDLGPIVLGGNVFGWTVDRDAAFRLLDAFVDLGGRAIDTADMYPDWAPGCVGGESEEILGAWMKDRGHRDRIFLATKVAKLKRRRGLSPDNIRAAVEDSLRRLQTDHIDLYYAHEDDPSVPQEVVVATFDALVREGKVRAVGASNFSAARLRSAVDLARSNGRTPFTFSQDQWNLMERDIETALVPTLVELGITELPYFGLASGFLTGKYRPGVEVDSERAGGVAGYLDDPVAPGVLAALDDIAAAHDSTVAAVALSWLRTRPTVGAPIASARTLAHLPALFDHVQMGPEELARLTQAATPVG